MLDKSLRRRDFLRLGLASSLVGLSGCGLTPKKNIFGAYDQPYFKDLVGPLSSRWRFKSLNGFVESSPYEVQLFENLDLVALNDGWLSKLPLNSIKIIEAYSLTSKLNKKSLSFLDGLGPALSSRVFPLGFTPWVMVFRGGEPFVGQASESWGILLDERLKGEVVFPESPYFLSSIAQEIGGMNYLEKLLNQAKAFDDRNGLNWLISGRAKLAILPLSSCIGSILKDPRLSVAFPKSGTPLSWTVVVHSSKSKEQFPVSWVEQLWQLPLLSRTLSKGLIPPIEYAELVNAIDYIPQQFRSVLIPSRKIMDNCWSLLPLNTMQRKNMEEEWIKLNR